MKRLCLALLALWGGVSGSVHARLSVQDLHAARGKVPGALVVIDATSGETLRSDATACAEKLPPCSTFKIWNSLIGLETGILTSPDAPFYHWDGVKRSYPDWNRDLTLKEAFQVSCVPAYQALARQIGSDRMKSWLHKINYGDQNLSAGLDTFWLPAPDRKTLLISPDEQAALMQTLATGKTPFSKQSLRLLKDIMLYRKTERGALYGKTGSGTVGKQALGWFVGYLESGGTTYAFACTVTGAGRTGKDARALVETLWERQHLL